MKESLKKIVFRLMQERKAGIDFNFDQEVVNAHGELPNFQTVEKYKTAWHRQEFMRKATATSNEN